MSTPLSRRQVLRAAALCGLGAAASRAAETQSAIQNPQSKIRIGIATQGFPGVTNAALAKMLSGAGFKLIQLFLAQTDSKFWKYGIPSDVSSMTPARCREIAKIYRDAGLEIHSMGVYATLIHPGEAERKANLAYFEAMMDIGGHMDVHTFITEAGHWRDTVNPAPAFPYDLQEAVWTRMVATGRELAAAAARRQAKVLMEPFFGSFFASAKRLRMYLEEVNSPHIRALLDPANLIEFNDLDEMFQQLAPWVDCLHAKDRKHHVERGVGAGMGDIDYKKFVTLAAQKTPAAPLILEYVGPQDYRQALDHLRRAMREAGVGEA